MSLNLRQIFLLIPDSSVIYNNFNNYIISDRDEKYYPLGLQTSFINPCLQNNKLIGFQDAMKSSGFTIKYE